MNNNYNVNCRRAIDGLHFVFIQDTVEGSSQNSKKLTSFMMAFEVYFYIIAGITKNSSVGTIRTSLASSC